MTLSKRSFLQNMLVAPALAAPVILQTKTAPVRAESPKAKANTNPGFYRYKVGDIEVTALLDGYFSLPAKFVLGFDEKVARQSSKKSRHRYTPGSFQLPVNGYVIKTGKETVLLDAGAPTFISPTLGGLTANMAAAGIDPKDITTVLLTHTHPDHVGALAGKGGSKVFENANLMCSQTEWDFIHNDQIRNAAPKDFQGMFDMARSALAPYKEQRKLFTGETELLTGITSVPLPGHTPGHTGYALHSKNESLLIWGDIIHLSALQFANPDWGVVFDTDPALAKKTRRDMFDRANADNMAVAGMHVDFPGIGYVEKAGIGYRYLSAPYMPA